MDIKPTCEELTEKINRLETLIENMGVPMAVIDESGRLLMLNRSIAAYLGGRPDDFIGQAIGDLLPEDSIQILQHIREVYRSGKASSSEDKFYLISGERWFLSNYIPLLDEYKKVYAVQMISIDITDRKKAEDALKESEEIFHCFLEHNPIYVFFKDENIRSVKLSKNYEQMLGMPLHKILGKTMDDLFPSDLAKGMIEDDKRVFIEGRQISVEEEFNGRFYESIKFPILFNGKPKYLAGYTMDITEQKRIKDTLESNIVFLKTLLDTIPNPIYYLDKESRILGANRAWADMIIGMNIEDIIGRTMSEVCEKVPKELTDRHKYRDSELIETGGTQIFESKIRCTDGQERDFVFYKSAFTDAEGELAGIVGVLLDITDRKHAEEEKRTLHQRLLQAQKMESIGTLAGGIAHDFNNILMPILAFSELAAMKLPPDSPIQSDVKQIHNAAERAKDLVHQILTFARQQGTERVPIKFSHILKETLKLLRSSTPSTIDVSCKIDAEHDTVLANPTQLNQIIMNLTTNAVHAMEDEGGSLEILLLNEDIDVKSAENFAELEPGRYIKLIVRDTGHGISPHLLEKIFEPYFTTKERGKGTGMGLSIVHGIVKNYGGEIIVQSKINHGTSFHVYIPAVEIDTSVHQQTHDTGPFRTGTERILVVDDEKVSLDTIKSMLEWLGYKITGRTSSIEALEAFRYNPNGFDLVVTDQTMPNMTGRTLASAHP